MFGRKNKKEAKKNTNVEAANDMTSTKSSKSASNCSTRNCSNSSSKR